MKADLLWLDMEMTGLDVEREVPIEVAALATDWKMNVLGEYHAVIRQPDHYLANMDDWNQKHHRASGLLAQIPSGQDPVAVDMALVAFLDQHFKAGERVILAGNSISQDRLFIRKYMPRLEARLHYRMLDVTAWKVVFNGLYERKFKKNDTHRALDDIRESIAELQFYLGFVRD